MKKQDFIKELSEQNQITRHEATVLFDAVIDELTRVLSKGNSITINTFGTFSVVKREKRKAFNPFIEKWMMLPPKLLTRFKSSEILKERINKNGK